MLLGQGARGSRFNDFRQTVHCHSLRPELDEGRFPPLQQQLSTIAMNM